MAGGCYGRGSYWKKLWAFWALVLEQAMNSSLGVTDCGLWQVTAFLNPDGQVVVVA